MKNSILLLFTVAAVFTACNQKSEKAAEAIANAEATPSGTKEERIKRGEYLVTVMGCNDCHTPKKMTAQGPVLDSSRMLSGHNGSVPSSGFDTALTRKGEWIIMSSGITSFAGPWGMSFAANLTPDATGLAGWTIDNFKTAIKKGKFKGIEAERTLLPPMPWQNLVNISDGDAEAIFDYLQSLKPVSNKVPNAIIAQH
ncbi:diheme cytochrome c-553 [Polluticoccus soli]|uniref:diheme cytochrome c-553 n=1 Tax=Polluticoccus soli TaxID=3034150 RepID=UPI0023E335CA|nr:diheme cytochrome c-553 [Flavipsychrobacter sp. JY13-12]